MLTQLSTYFHMGSKSLNDVLSYKKKLVSQFMIFLDLETVTHFFSVFQIPICRYKFFFMPIYSWPESLFTEENICEMVNILIGCTGSVASIKIPELVETIKKEIPSANIALVATTASKSFFDETVINSVHGIKVNFLIACSMIFARQMN